MNFIRHGLPAVVGLKPNTRQALCTFICTYLCDHSPPLNVVNRNQSIQLYLIDHR